MDKENNSPNNEIENEPENALNQGILKIFKNTEEMLYCEQIQDTNENKTLLALEIINEILNDLEYNDDK